MSLEAWGIGLQRKFYAYFGKWKKRLTKLSIEHFSNFYSRYAGIAQHFFEGCTYPNLTILKSHFQSLVLDELPDFHLAETRMVSVEKIWTAKSLPPILARELERFETKFLSSPEKIYRSYDGFGGD